MTEVMQRRLIMLFCLRCSNDLVTLHETEIAFHLRISNEEMAETKALFVSKGFIDNDWNIQHWEKRQFVSDSSAARVARHREKKQKSVKQQCNVTVTPPDTDTDTDTEEHTSLRSVCESAHALADAPDVTPIRHDTPILVPDDLQPDRQAIATSTTLSIDIALETAKFIAYHQAQGTTRNGITAWQAQFRKWLLDQHQFNADRAKVTDAKVKAVAKHSTTSRDESRSAAYASIGLGGNQAGNRVFDVEEVGHASR